MTTDADHARPRGADATPTAAPATYRLVDAESDGLVLLEVAPDGRVVSQTVPAAALVRHGVRIPAFARSDFGGRAFVQPGSPDYVRALGAFLRFEGFQEPRFQWWHPGFRAAVTRTTR